MPDPLPSCFRAGGTAPSSGDVARAGATSVYDTFLGLAALSWSRTLLGLSLRLDLRLPDSGGGDSDECLHFRIRPWLLWRRRGSRRFTLNSHHHGALELHWDLSRARFPSSGAPDPSSSFYVAALLDGRLLLVSGDLLDDARRKAAGGAPFLPTPLVSRREHAELRGASSYATAVPFRSRLLRVSIDLPSADEDEDDRSLSVSLDGEQALHVRRLRWKFRGTERVDLSGGGHVQISWDLHNWLFPPEKDDAPPPPLPPKDDEPGRAVFLLRFEEDPSPGLLWGKPEMEEHIDKANTCSGCGGGGGERRRLLKTPSSSSMSPSSHSSTTSGSSVMDWASPEEAQLRSAGGFSLLVYASKS